jgi:hypothetical protein
VMVRFSGFMARGIATRYVGYPTDTTFWLYSPNLRRPTTPATAGNHSNFWVPSKLFTRNRYRRLEPLKKLRFKLVWRVFLTQQRYCLLKGRILCSSIFRTFVQPSEGYWRISLFHPIFLNASNLASAGIRCSPGDLIYEFLPLNYRSDSYHFFQVRENCVLHLHQDGIPPILHLTHAQPSDCFPFVAHYPHEMITGIIIFRSPLGVRVHLFQLLCAQG